ncbi:MAG: type II secretion system protein [Candidatus Omnitrophota bacterium]|nr:type II secretion system protein [Candidatus Omnitrophota bacterium]
MRSGDRGFSLIELMCGVVILLIISISALFAFINSMLLNESSRNRVIAANDAQYALEQIKEQDFNDIQTYIGNYNTTFTNLAGESITFPNPIYTSTLDTITVQVVWNERNETRAFTLTTRFAQE